MLVSQRVGDYMSFVIDFANVFLLSLSWLPSPIPELCLGLIAIYAIIMLLRLVALVLDALPFL